MSRESLGITHPKGQFILSPSDTVNTFRLDNGKIHYFTGTKLLKRLRLAVTALGPDPLGLTASEIGWRRYGHVPRSCACFHNYAIRAVVKRRLPQIYTKASKGIQQ